MLKNIIWSRSEEITLGVLIGLAIILIMVFSPGFGQGSTPLLFQKNQDFFRIDLNQAGCPELDLLSGIGPTRARQIIDYRQSIGRFHDLNELTNIKGISRELIDQIKNKVRISESSFLGQ